MCTFPGSDSHKVGWMIPSPVSSARSTSRYSVCCHVLPPSSLRSMNTSHLPSSCDAPASQLPSDKMMGLLRTGPRPPWSPGTNSYAADHVSPLSSDVITHVSHFGIVLPTLKYRMTWPDGAWNNTGFQWGSFRIFATSYGAVQLSPSPLEIQIPTSSSFSRVPPNEATRKSPFWSLTNVDAWHCGKGLLSPNTKERCSIVGPLLSSVLDESHWTNKKNAATINMADTARFKTVRTCGKSKCIRCG